MTNTPGPLRGGNPRGNPNLAPRRGARTRAGCPCRGPAMANGKCRMHGGASTGPRTQDGIERLRAARTSHGYHGPAGKRFREHTAVIRARGRAITALSKAHAPAEEWAAVLAGIGAGPAGPGPAVKNVGRTLCNVSGVRRPLPATAGTSRDDSFDAVLMDRLHQRLPWLAAPARGQDSLVGSARFSPRRTRRTTKPHEDTGPSTVHAPIPPVPS